MGSQQSFRETFARGGSLLKGGPLFNRERAEKVLKEESLDGLIVAEPVNVFHLTGYWPQLGKMGFAAPSMALLSADAKKPVALVMPQFLYYYVYADANFSGEVEPWLYTHRPSAAPPSRAITTNPRPVRCTCTGTRAMSRWASWNCIGARRWRRLPNGMA